MNSAAIPNKSTLIVRRLYRSLLKAAQPFTRQQPGYPSPVVLNCLLFRTGHEDHRSWHDFLRAEEAPGSSDSDSDDDNDTAFDLKERTADALFLKLLKQTVTGSPTSTGLRQMQVPATVDCTRLSNIIHQEFRRPLTSSKEDLSVRRQVAFRALRELHKKLLFAENLKARSSSGASNQLKLQRQENVVHSLPLRPSSSYLRPGAFLLAHPLLPGFFRQSVICILDHVSEYDSDDDSVAGNSDKDDPPLHSNKAYGTYGLVINRLSTTSMAMAMNARPLTLPDVLTPLPDIFSKSPIGTLPLREGGPVHFSLQMLYSATAEQHEEWKFGGTLLPSVVVDDQQSTALRTDRAVYYRGELMKVAHALRDGKLTDGVALFVGCSTWTEGQLEREVEQGCWLPCAAPATVALTGSLACDGSADNDNTGTPSQQQQQLATPDLWLSLMASLGEEEGQLAHLLQGDDLNDENGAPCDEG